MGSEFNKFLAKGMHLHSLLLQRFMNHRMTSAYCDLRQKMTWDGSLADETDHNNRMDSEETCCDSLVGDYIKE